jgi:hypothetical protein
MPCTARMIGLDVHRDWDLALHIVHSATDQSGRCVVTTVTA